MFPSTRVRLVFALGTALAVFFLAGCNTGLVDLRVEAPSFSVAAGSFASDISVELSTTTENATIYYTTDGTNAGLSSTVYQGPIAVRGPLTTVEINAFADAEGLQASEQVTARYTIDWPDLTLERTGDGTVVITDSTTSGPEPVVLGEAVAISAAPAENFSFDGWTVTSDNTNQVTIADASAPETTVTLDGGDATVSASFVLTATPPAPSAPTVSLSPDVAVTQEDVTLSISDIDADAVVEYSTNGGGAWISYTDPVVLSSEGVFAVTARQTGPNGAVSPETPEIDLTIDKTSPDPIANLSASPGTDTVELTWDNPADDGLAEVELTWTPADGESQPVTVGAPQSQYEVTGLRPETLYSFTAISVDEATNRSGEASAVATTGSVFESGPGSLIAVPVSGEPFNPKGVLSVDMDLDGDMDAVTADDDSASGQIHGHYNDGTASLDASTRIAHSGRGNSPGDPAAIAATDLDGDNDPDVVAAWLDDGGDRIVWYENREETDPSASEQFADGQGSTYAIASSGRANEPSTPSDLVLTDVDGDSDPDVLAALEGEDRVVWYENRLNETEGDFSTGTAIDSNAPGVTNLFAGDLDGDMDVDVVAAVSDEDEFRWYSNDGTGSFSAESPLPAITNQTSAEDVVAADFDDDGDLDLAAVVQINFSPSLAWWENDLDGTGASWSATVLDETIIFPSTVHAADLDADGDPDLLAGARKGTFWYRNDLPGGGDFAERVEISETGTDEPAAELATADLDGDGDQDVLAGINIASQFEDDEFRIYLNRLVD